MLLQHGETRGWWKYESENQPGHVDRAGQKYPGDWTYTIRLNTADVPDDDDGHAPDERVLLGGEVDGYVLATADQYGPDAVAEIAYRPGLY